MNQYAGALLVCGCFGALAAMGAGCDNGSGGSGGAAGAPVSGTAGAPPGTAGAPSGTAGAPPGTGGAAGGDVLLIVGDTGFVSGPLGIEGSWYGYGDGQGTDGTVATSNCVAVGKHMPSDCSVITTPVPGSGTFPPTTPGGMCTAGTVAKVLPLATPCPIVAPATVAPATCPDYSNLFGAGIGLDLNNPGLDGGTGVKMPFNATAAGIIGISFDVLDTPPLAGLRVEFPTMGTELTSAVWKPTGTANLSPVVKGHNIVLFADVKSPSYITPAIPFDPTTLISIQFHVPTNTANTATYSFCIGNFSVITNGSTPVSGTAGASGTAGSSGAGTAGASAGTAGAGTAGAGTGGAGTAGAGTGGAGTAGAGTAGAGTAGAGTAGAGTAGAAQ